MGFRQYWSGLILDILIPHHAQLIVHKLSLASHALAPLCSVIPYKKRGKIYPCSTTCVVANMRVLRRLDELLVGFCTFLPVFMW